MIPGYAVDTLSTSPTAFDIAALIFSTALTILGFALAIWQIQKTKTAVDAAREARVEASTEIVANQLNRLLREIQLVSNEIEEDNSHNDLAALRRTLSKYAWVCNESAYLVGKLPSVNTEFVGALKASARTASETKEAVVLGTLTSVAAVMQMVFPSVIAVSTLIPDAAKALEFQLHSNESPATKVTK